jgi:hypothetical protein
VLFRKIIPCLHRESYETHTYKTEHYWKLKHVVCIVTTRF